MFIIPELSKLYFHILYIMLQQTMFTFDPSPTPDLFLRRDRYPPKPLQTLHWICVQKHKETHKLWTKKHV